MALHCTLAGGPQSLFTGPPCELTLDAPDGTPGRVVQKEMATRFGTGILTVEGRQLGSLVLGEPPLINGAVMVDDGGRLRKHPLPHTPPGDAAAGLALAVHTGPGAGTIVPLARGSYTLGRSGARILVQDPELSRLHARLDVTDSDISITDLDSANGTYVDGKKILRAVVSTGSTIRCGNTGLALVFRDAPGRALASAGSSVRSPIIVRGQAGPGNRLVLLLTAALPLVLGTSLALATGMWMFLAFAVASVGSLLVPLVTGRRQRRKAKAAIAAAVAQDRERRHSAGPTLAVLMLSAGRTPDRAEDPEAEGLWLRLGEAPQPANVQLEPPGAAVPSAGTVPVLLDPQRPRTVFRGTRTVADAMIRALLMQMACYPLGRGTPVVIHGAAASLPLPARYLPAATLTASAAACRAALAEVPESTPPTPGVLVLTGSSRPPEVETVLAEAALELGWRVLQFLSSEAPRTDCDVVLAERESVLWKPDGTVHFIPDLAPATVFDTFCRRLAARADAPRSSIPVIPASCRLDEVLPSDPVQTAARWRALATAPGLAVPLGMGPSAPQFLDLQSDGPHLLVAGTTGSGKSELLRSLVVSLALSYPPDRVNFLFIDFKGGSGLGPLAGLVHCTGMLTDLSSHGLDRTLVSLRAEVRFREQVLSAAGAPDLAALGTSPSAGGAPLPHLVIVIDEFRMLVDDHPEVLRELMRIASIGRSLGIHLVMATQRPQGALTADIRANVTSSIALRVQSEMESMDIINHRGAAGISIGRPGRAFLARGTEPAREFQTASVQSGRTTAEHAVRVRLAVEYLLAPSAEAKASALPTQTPVQAVEPLLSMVRDLWSAAGGRAPRRPVAAPLPQQLPEPEPEDDVGVRAGGTPAGAASRDQSRALFGSATRSGASCAWRIPLGLADLPARQDIEVLHWDPLRDGHLALVGGAASGTAEALESISRRLLCHPAESHAYVLDAGGGLLQLAGCRRTGAYVGLHEQKRAARLLGRLAEELTLRLSRREVVRTPILVVVAGWGSWASAFRVGPYSWAEDLLQDLVRDGQSAGITLLLAGDRELVTARFTAAVPNRLYFPAGSTEESRLAWPRLPATEAVKGRAVAVGPVAGTMPSACQLYEGGSSGDASLISRQAWRLAGVPAPIHAPLRVEPLPALVTASELRTRATAAQGGRRAEAARILLGLGGDELMPAYFRLSAGGVFAVLGGAASGKTNALQAIEELNTGQADWLRPGAGQDPGDYWKQRLAAARAGTLSRQSILLVDDADRLPPYATRDVADLHGLGHGVVFTAAPGPLLSQRVPLAMEARSSGTGLLLCPRSLSDGELYGVRFDVEPHPVPGRAVLIESGRAELLQVAVAGSSNEEQRHATDGGYSAGGPPPVREA